MAKRLKMRHWDSAVSLKIESFHSEFRRWERAAEVCQSLVEATGLKLLGRPGAKYVTPLRAASLSELKANDNLCLWLVVQDVPGIELNVAWNAPTEFEAFAKLGDGKNINYRLQVWLTFEAEEQVGFAREFLRLAIEQMSPFWAELNVKRLAKELSFCGYLDHGVLVPRLGCEDYFGPDYTAFLGRLQKLNEAGFASVESIADGALVRLPECNDHEAFRAVQERVQNALCPGGFGRKGAPVPKFREYEKHVMRYAAAMDTVTIEMTNSQGRSVWKKTR
jgi:hypothetical protein